MFLTLKRNFNLSGKLGANFFRRKEQRCKTPFLPPLLTCRQWWTVHCYEFALFPPSPTKIHFKGEGVTLPFLEEEEEKEGTLETSQVGDDATKPGRAELGEGEGEELFPSHSERKEERKLLKKSSSSSSLLPGEEAGGERESYLEFGRKGRRKRRWRCCLHFKTG